MPDHAMPHGVVVDDDIVVDHVHGPDVIDVMDYRKVVDPLMEPGRRPPRHMIPPQHVAKWLNIPTHPWEDTFTPMGYLYRSETAEGDKTDDFRMLTLIGRRDRYHSAKYNYYALTKSGVKIEIQLLNGKHELYQDDIITLKEFPGDYKVTLYKPDGPYYNPHAF
jgi:hypothetical protein